MGSEIGGKGVELRRIQAVSEYLPMVDREDADGEFYDAVAENGEEIYAVCVRDSAVGLCCASGGGADGFLYVYIFPPHRGRGYGREAVRMAEGRMRSPKLESITTCYDCGNEAARKFARVCGYVRGFSSAYMKYQGGPFEEKPLPVRRYRDEDYAQAQKLSAEAFHQMRVGTGCFPDSVPEAPSAEMRRHWADTAAERYVYVLEDELVGYADLDGAELSCVAIKISRQGQGLGKAFVQFLVNRLLEKGHREPFLYCVVGNKARRLYDSLGFRETARGEYAKKRMKI